MLKLWPIATKRLVSAHHIPFLCLAYALYADNDWVDGVYYPFLIYVPHLNVESINLSFLIF